MTTYISNFGIENFRVFKDHTHFEFAPITILVGPNGSGKSSLAKALSIASDISSIAFDEHDKISLRRVGEQNILKNSQHLDYFSSVKSFNSKDQLIHLHFRCPQLHENMDYSPILRGAVFSVRLAYAADTRSRFLPNSSLEELSIKADVENEESIEVLSFSRRNRFSDLKINWKFFYGRYLELFKQREAYNLENPKPRGKKAKLSDLVKDPFFLFNKQLEGTQRFQINHQFLKLSATIKPDNSSADSVEDILSDVLERLHLKSKSSFGHFSEEELFAILTDRLESFIKSDDFITVSSTAFDCLDLIIDQNVTMILSDQLYRIYASFNPNKINISNEEWLLKSFLFRTSFVANQNGEAARVFFKNFVLGPICQIIKHAIRPHQFLNFQSPYRGEAPRRFILKQTSTNRTDLNKLLAVFIQLDKETRKQIEKSLQSLVGVDGFGVADRVVIRPSRDINDSVFIEIIRGNNRINLADEAFGIRAIIQILLLIALSDDKLIAGLKKYQVEGEPWANLSYQGTFLIEEPESNLHPALQSKLADLFVEASKAFNTQFIIETHSEYLIRKLQFLTAKKEISPEDTVIYYFYPPDHPDVVSGREPQVKKINIRADGSLTGEFGSGFFDEADNIALELFLLKKSQEN